MTLAVIVSLALCAGIVIGRLGVQWQKWCEQEDLRRRRHFDRQLRAAAPTFISVGELMRGHGAHRSRLSSADPVAAYMEAMARAEAERLDAQLMDIVRQDPARRIEDLEIEVDFRTRVARIRGQLNEPSELEVNEVLEQLERLSEE